jgi:tyrosyl-tRNA synthetase
MRPPLSREEIDANSATYIKQLGLIVDTQRIEIRRNSDWYSKLDFREVINLTSKVTLAQMMQREDFKNRFDAGRPIHLHEVLYPILQGYDSVMVNADIELGGVDQLFNNLMGRTLQRALGSPGQAVITTPLLIGLDGVEKMSKSKNNYIGLTDSPEDMYGKVMSIPDRLIPDYLEFATTFDGTKKALLREALVSGTNPMTVKKEIAANIVARYNSEKAAAQAMAHFERVTQQRDLKDSDYIPLALSTLYSAFPTAPSLVDLCDLATSGMSRSHIRRLIRSGGVLVDGRKILDERASVDIAPGRTLSVGKRTRFIVTPDEA